MVSRIDLSRPNAYKLMCFDRNINGNRDVKFLIGIIGHCTDERNLLYEYVLSKYESSKIIQITVCLSLDILRSLQKFVKISHCFH